MSAPPSEPEIRSWPFTKTSKAVGKRASAFEIAKLAVPTGNATMPDVFEVPKFISPAATVPSAL